MNTLLGIILTLEANGLTFVSTAISAFCAGWADAWEERKS